MLYHHSKQDYETTAKKAGEYARNRLQEIINKGKGSVENTLNRIFTQIPDDVIVPANRIEFLPETQGVILGHPTGTHSTERKWQGIHENALSQLCSKANLPIRYARDLISQFNQKEDDGTFWGPELLAHNLNELMKNSQGRHLLRSVDGQVRGFLSDRYKRLDSQQLAEQFVTSMKEVGAIPIKGNVSDTSFHLRALLPQVYEPIPNEVMAFGMSWSNSDFGRGANVIEVFAMRLWCTNCAIGQDRMRQVHVGQRFADGHIDYSKKTKELDTKASLSAMRDVIVGGLKEESIHGILKAIQEAHEENIDAKSVFNSLNKRLNKGTAERVIETFNSPDIENLPPGNSRWRMSNALSWVAQDEELESQFKLMRMAGEYANMK